MNPSCLSGYHLGSQLYQTPITQIYDVCDETKGGTVCHYIVKMIPLDRVGAEDEFRRQVSYLQLLDPTGIAPRLLGFCIDNNVGYVIMEKLGSTMEQVGVHQFQTYMNSLSADPALVPTYPGMKLFTENQILSVLNVVAQLHQAGVVHNDLHLGNIILGSDVQLIDFAGASNLTPNSQWTDYSQLEALLHPALIQTETGIGVFRGFGESIIPVGMRITTGRGYVSDQFATLPLITIG